MIMNSYDSKKLFWEKTSVKSTTSSMIPKIIHQMWIGPQSPPFELLKTWKEKNPSWQYVFWDNLAIKKFKFKNQAQIDKMEEWNGKCDIMRYEILHQMGGFFVDADTICLRPLNDELFTYDNIAVYENEKSRGGLVACGYMGCKPESELMKLCIENIEIVESPAWWYVGPAYFTEIINRFYPDIKIHNSELFIPNHYSGHRTNNNPYADHLWGNTYKNYNKLSIYKASEQTTPQHQLKPLKIRNCRRQGILSQYYHKIQDHK